MWSADDLIVACATPRGPGGRAIVRLAGDGLDAALAGLFDMRAAGTAPSGGRPRVVVTRLAGDLAGAWGAVPVDVLHWPGPAGPIGGPLAEVQLPCSGPLVDAVTAAACRHGARLARGGEFTLRAFLSGRLDLLQAEAVLAVVDAGTPAELVAALDRLAGGAGGHLRRLRDDLLDVLADIEAAIDFADETTPDAAPAADVAMWCGLARRIDLAVVEIDRIGAALDGRDAAGTDLPRVVLAGPPNVGKSSLYNALVGREAALVADEAGTTRDWLEARLALPAAGGAPVACMLVDVAGVDAAGAAAGVGSGPHAAVARAHGDPAAAAREAACQAVGAADVLVVCRDAVTEAGAWCADDGRGGGAGVPPDDGRPRILVHTRCDRAAGAADSPPTSGTAAERSVIPTSSRTGLGLHALAAAIAAAVAALPPRGSPATVRLAAGLDAAARALAPARDWSAAAAAGAVVDEALLAGHVRAAVAALGEVTGVEIGPDLIERIFARHCVGK
jgi:tRNA modification GTPase